ncbi:hypothetical protein D3C75_610760 [compost metagenome]
MVLGLRIVLQISTINDLYVSTTPALERFLHSVFTEEVMRHAAFDVLSVVAIRVLAIVHLLVHSRPDHVDDLHLAIAHVTIVYPVKGKLCSTEWNEDAVTAH